MDPLSHFSIPRNHPNIIDYQADIKAYIYEELRLGCFLGPFTPPQLFNKIGPFRSSPFQIVAKAGINGAPTKVRVCWNLSHKGPSGRSVNDKDQL